MVLKNNKGRKHVSSVAAIVVTWNRVDNALRWIKSIKEQTYPVSDIIVVDNCSRDNTVEAIHSKYPDVTVVKMEENMGHAGGAQSGIEEALKQNHEWFWMFDDDAFPDEFALEKCLDAAERLKQNKPGLIYAPFSNEAGWNWKGYKIPVRFSEDDTNKGKPIQVVQVDFNMTLVSQEAIKSVGLPYGKYFMMGWEIEYCMRIAKGGFSCWIVPEIMVCHEHAGYKKQAVWRAFYQSRNHILTTKKHPSLSNIFWCIARQLRLTLGAACRLPMKRKLLWMRLKGIFFGLLGRQGKLIDPAKFE